MRLSEIEFVLCPYCQIQLFEGEPEQIPEDSRSGKDLKVRALSGTYMEDAQAISRALFVNPAAWETIAIDGSLCPNTTLFEARHVESG